MWRDVQQNSDEWLAMRLGKVTASGASLFMANLGKAFGEPAKKYAVELALQRVTGKASETYTNPIWSVATSKSRLRGHCTKKLVLQMLATVGFLIMVITDAVQTV